MSTVALVQVNKLYVVHLSKHQRSGGTLPVNSDVSSVNDFSYYCGRIP